jgi:tRNA-2-methylthio-N6-dimethylallyladenosine synthase
MCAQGSLALSVVDYRGDRPLESAGVREVTLLGQNVNSYRFEQGGKRYGFPDLLSDIAARCSSIAWLRFASPIPKIFRLI